MEERHGTGPIHFAGNLESGVIEIYPSKISIKMTFGLMVKSLEAFQSAWLAGGGSASATGILFDPYGNSVHLCGETGLSVSVRRLNRPRNLINPLHRFDVIAVSGAEFLQLAGADQHARLERTDRTVVGIDGIFQTVADLAEMFDEDA